MRFEENISLNQQTARYQFLWAVILGALLVGCQRGQSVTILRRRKADARTPLISTRRQPKRSQKKTDALSALVRRTTALTKE
jgi:hypothetical protein